MIIIKSFENAEKSKCVGASINEIAETPPFWDIALGHWVLIAQRLETA
jgi:hypothetical protein